jgi:O-antigen/teichoic acid export membrane protein
VRNVFSNSGANALGLFLQLAVLTVISQFVTTDDYATYLVVTAMIGMAEIGSDFGTRIWAARSFALTEHPANVFVTSLLGKLFYSVGTVLVLLCLRFNHFGTTEAILCALIAMTQPGTDPLLWYLRGVERLDVEAVAVLINRLTVAGMTVFLVVAGWSMEAVFAGWFLCNAIRIIAEASLSIMRPLFAVPHSNRALLFSRLRQIIVTTVPLGSSLFCMSVFHRLGILVLNVIGTSTDVAVFGTGYRFASAASFVAMSVGVAMFPGLVRAVDRKDAQDANRIIRAEVVAITALFFPLCTLSIWTLPTLMQWAYSGELSSTGWVMVLLMPGLYVSAINIGTKFTLNAFQLNWYDTASVVAAMLSSISVLVAAHDIPLCYRAALAWGAGEVMLFFFKLMVLWRHHRQIDLRASFVAVALAMLIGCAAIRWNIDAGRESRLADAWTAERAEAVLR